MITITQPGTKDELKLLLSAVSREVSSVERRYKNRTMPLNILRLLNNGEHILRTFKLSVTELVRVENMVIDIVPLRRLLKKIKNFEKDLIITDKGLRLSYWNNNSSGSLELYDLSDRFGHLEQIPVGVIDGET